MLCSSLLSQALPSHVGCRVALKTLSLFRGCLMYSKSSNRLCYSHLLWSRTGLLQLMGMWFSNNTPNVSCFHLCDSNLLYGQKYVDNYGVQLVHHFIITSKMWSIKMFFSFCCGRAWGACTNCFTPHEELWGETWARPYYQTSVPDLIIAALAELKQIPAARLWKSQPGLQ